MFRFAAPLLAILLLPLGSAYAHRDYLPSDAAYAVVASEANQVVCRAEEIKDVLKPALRGTPCYLKLRITNAKIHSTATRVRRRADHCWKARWEHEFDRLDSLLCDLEDLVAASYQASTVSPCPWGHCLEEISLRISEMSYRVACMRQAYCGTPVVSPYQDFGPAPMNPPVPAYPTYPPAPTAPIPVNPPADQAPQLPNERPSVLLPPTTMKAEPLPPPVRQNRQVQRPPVDIARRARNAETGQTSADRRRSVLQNDNDASIPIEAPQSRQSNGK